SGLNFIYADPETHQSGIMGTICGGASSNITNQRQQSDDQFLVFTFNTPTTECAPTADEICIRIDTASRVSNDEFRLTSREWIKYRVNDTQAKFGYFLERRTLSTALCGQDQQSETVAILK